MPAPCRAFIEVTLPLSLPRHPRRLAAGVRARDRRLMSTPIPLGGFQIADARDLIYQQISANFNVGFAAAPASSCS